MSAGIDCSNHRARLSSNGSSYSGSYRENRQRNAKVSSSMGQPSASLTLGGLTNIR
jgi:hypothetical protein